MTARCDKDLSPGSTTSPVRRPPACTISLLIAVSTLEWPYRIRRRDGSAEQRAAVTTWLSDVKSRHNYYQGLIRLHASARVADAYDGFVAAAIADAGPQMTHAWRRAPTRRDREVPLGSGYDRSRADVAKAAVIVEMERSLAPRWRRWAVRS